jgi:hypothetical protein
MKSDQAELIRQLLKLGYETRIEDGHVNVLAREGREIVRIPLLAFLNDDSLRAAG